MVASRIVLSDQDKLVTLRAYRAYIVDLTRVSTDMHGWAEAEQAYRLATAIHKPQRGVRPNKMKGYDWYLFNDRDAPLRHIDQWIAELKNAKMMLQAVNLDDATHAPLNLIEPEKK